MDLRHEYPNATVVMKKRRFRHMLEDDCVMLITEDWQWNSLTLESTALQFGQRLMRYW